MEVPAGSFPAGHKCHGLWGLVAAAHPAVPAQPPQGLQPCPATHNSCFQSNFTEGQSSQNTKLLENKLASSADLSQPSGKFPCWDWDLVSRPCLALEGHRGDLCASNCPQPS